jgi:tRNA dimethylallyltransferase
VSPPRVVALFGPTASGKTAVAGLLRERLRGEVVSADSAALYAGIPVLTAAPDYPARLVGVVSLDRDVSVGQYQRLAHEAIDDILAAGAVAIVAGGTGLYLRAALSTIALPPAPAPGSRERWSGFYDEVGADRAHAVLARLDPAAGARVHPNDRRRVVRALELTDVGASLAPAESSLWRQEYRHSTLLLGLDLDTATLDARIAARVSAMIERGAVAEAAAAWEAPLSTTARKVLGLEQLATLPAAAASDAVVAATRRLARYQRKWLRRLPVAATLDGGLRPEELVDAIVALAGAGECVPRC